MVAILAPKPARRRNRVEGHLELRGQQFPFYLVRQDVTLKPAGRVQFYYMHPGDLRSRDPEREISNFRSCIGYWFAAMHEIGAADDWHQQRHFVMAICYALVNRDKGPQSIYRDSFLRPDSIAFSDFSLPDEIRLRLKQVVQDRDRDAIKKELDVALGACELSRGDLLGYQRAFGIWVDKGVNAFRHKGEDGVVEWLKEVDDFIRFYRKRCALRVRGFINFFAFQAKISFYLCYANFWASLIPWLQKHYKLDLLSSRFLSIWHNQNHPVEIPHGRTRGGILYPTQAGAALLLPDGHGGFAPRRLVWKTEQIGPTHIPDVFSGQVLSLHPLSWLLLSDPALRAVVGRFIASPRFESSMQAGDIDDFEEYWGFIDAVLTAAHLYRQARDDYENRRGVHEAGGDATEKVAADGACATIDDADSASPNSFFVKYVLTLKRECDCGGQYEFQGIMFGPPEENRQTTRELLLNCDTCSARRTLDVTKQEMASHLAVNGL